MATSKRKFAQKRDTTTKTEETALCRKEITKWLKAGNTITQCPPMKAYIYGGLN